MFEKALVWKKDSGKDKPIASEIISLSDIIDRPKKDTTILVKDVIKIMYKTEEKEFKFENSDKKSVFYQKLIERWDHVNSLSGDMRQTAINEILTNEDSVK